MALWFVVALMTIAAIFAVVWPLMRANRRLRSGSDVAVYKDQLEEIQRDRNAGLIGESEAEAAQVEVSRRLLAAADAETALAPEAPAAPIVSRGRVAVLAALVISVGSASVYLALGSPSLPGQPLASREKSLPVDAMLAQVEDHLARNPRDGHGWEVIAPLYLRLGRFDDAVKARRAALALSGETSDRLAGLGEALMAAADGNISAEARKLFERAVTLDRQNIKARYFLGVAAEQGGHPNDAAARNIKNGDYIRVFNDRGSFEGKAELSTDVQEGLAVANLGYWPGLSRSGSAVNATTSSSHCNLGGAGCQSDNRVEIARA